MSFVINNYHNKMQSTFSYLLMFMSVCMLVQCNNSDFNYNYKKKPLPTRSWGFTNDGTVEIKSLTFETLEGAMNIIKEVFFADESISKGCGISSEPGAAEELMSTCANVAKDGLSVVAINVNTTEVVGIALNKVLPIPKNKNEKSQFEKFGDNSKHKAAKCFVYININIESRVDLFDLYDVDCILEMTYLTVKRNFQHRGIAGLLVSSSLKLGKILKKGIPVKTSVNIDRTSITKFAAVPSLLAATITSKYSQKIFEKLGFDNVTEVSYDDLTFDGEKLSGKIDNINKFARIGAKRL